MVTFEGRSIHPALCEVWLNMGESGIEILGTSVVVLAERHNPTILHPAFLAAQGIVPEEWRYEEDLVCTPAISVVRYANGISFTVEANRLIVSEEKPEGNPLDAQVATLALAYVERLPHVRYTAVGINFTGCVFREQPGAYLIARFLKAGPWVDESRAARTVGLRFVYDADDAVLRLGIDEGHIERQDAEPRTAVLINGNFHSDFSGARSIDVLRHSLGRWADRLREFVELSGRVLGEGEAP